MKHMKKIVLLLTFSFFAALLSSAQQMQPLDIAKKIFAKEPFRDIKHYITDEYKGEPNGQDLNDSLAINYLLLEQNEKTAVVALAITAPSGKGADWYLHFTKDTGWKVCAFRGLAMTGIIERAVIELEKMTPQEVNEMIAASKKNKKEDDDFSFITSMDDYYFELGNSKLTIETDQNIINHFLHNRQAFEKLKDSVLTVFEHAAGEQDSLVKLLAPAYRKLFISSVSHNDGCLNFSIGGILDNTVGYFYVKDKKDLPRMNPRNMIMIREIGDGWYIYKTT